MKGVTGTYHAVHRHVGALAEIGQSLGQYYDSGARWAWAKSRAGKQQPEPRPS
jgi:hypothetical protein